MIEYDFNFKDIVAMIGGEEFCVLVPYTNKKVALTVAEKLREIVANTKIAVASDDITMTISIGVSQVEKANADHTAIVKRADRNMYKAKETGRNRVCI